MQVLKEPEDWSQEKHKAGTALCRRHSHKQDTHQKTFLCAYISEVPSPEENKVFLLVSTQQTKAEQFVNVNTGERSNQGSDTSIKVVGLD